MSDYDFTEKFIQALHEAGCPPEKSSDIIADDVFRRYKVAGEKTENAKYQLKIDGDFAYGRFIYFKEGVVHSWHGRSKTKVSKAEIEKRKKAYAIEREKRDMEQRQAQERAAKECQRAWRSGTARVHQYLTDKGVTPDGSRVADLPTKGGDLHRDVLMIPVYKDGTITSIQRIWGNGFKAFWEDGDVKGGYTALADEDDDKSNLIICEGWATGKTIRQATGLPVVVAFNAGNLEPVTRFMRKKYPDARLIIAADNDQWTINVKKMPNSELDKIKNPSKIKASDERWHKWREKGYLMNVGLDKARQAGVKASAHVIFPDIPFDNEEKATDFNDMAKLYGLERVKERIMMAMPQLPKVINEDDYGHFDSDQVPAHLLDAPIDESQGGRFDDLYQTKEQENIDWKEMLICDKNGKIKPKSLHNARVIIENHPLLRGIFVFDEFSQEEVVAHCPPWENQDKFEPRNMVEQDVTNLAMFLERAEQHSEDEMFISINLNTLTKVVNTLVMNNTRNPAQEYFNSLAWDRVPRLDTWLREYLGCVTDDPQYLAAVGRKWLTASVKRVFHPGCKFDSMLVLEGGQGVGKSTTLKELATIRGKEYFTDAIKPRDLTHPDKSVPKMQGILIVELAEMSGFAKLPPDEVKQAISTQTDRIIRKYANYPTDLPRKFVIAGTINESGGYLSDSTGNRRYWPVACTEANVPALKKVKEQLWAEAVHLYRKGETLYLEGDLLKKAEKAQENRRNQHPWHPEIERKFGHISSVSYDEIWQALGINDRSKRTRSMQGDIASIMTSLGFEHKRKRVGNERPYLWVKDESEIDLYEGTSDTPNDWQEMEGWD